MFSLYFFFGHQNRSRGFVLKTLRDLWTVQMALNFSLLFNLFLRLCLSLSVLFFSVCPGEEIIKRRARRVNKKKTETEPNKSVYKMKRKLREEWHRRKNFYSFLT